jgi:hypothetical protein
LGSLGWKNIAISAIRAFVGSAVMGVGVWISAGFILPAGNKTSLGLLAGVIASICIGIAIYGIVSYLLRSQEMSSVLTEARKGFGK